ncbi:hypothetical protein [Cyclobacterium marinum]|uniref:Uncharacterized protein n=1 Tax=Cyclobacterium marinum (strain ATCC 25205 / DSM 745 / LMG 13164 / NCIMB 1802) TaxID=880070 RepID=G0J6X8_CYCMS|nr:hypothetical protein [Cyclobacterium marinum]AEL26869.1 hypothetical protein Cycma_3141 [Cyclobacterium marinum DSM 745]
MNKEAKFSILKALKIGLLSKKEARILIRAKGIVKLDLSTNGNPDPICNILHKVPSMKKYFTNIISLGNGEI